jgi:hypothetical protein
MAETRRSARSGGLARSHPRLGKQDMRGLLIRLNYAGLKALRQLALDKDRTLQSIGVEALNDLLRKYGGKAVVENPLLRGERE